MNAVGLVGDPVSLSIPVGTQVRVSNSKPKPKGQDRYHRRHWNWLSENYHGVVTHHVRGNYVVGNLSEDLVVYCGRHYPEKRVTPIEGLPRLNSLIYGKRAIVSTEEVQQ